MHLNLKIIVALALCAFQADAKFQPLKAIKTKVEKFRNRKEKRNADNKAKLPIVFHPNYDIGFFGIEKLHPFDSKKYGKVYAHLRTKYNLDAKQFYTPEIVSDEQLTQVHTADYLASLQTSSNVARITENKAVAWMPNSLVQKKLLDPMRYATGGTVLGAQLALEQGWAINLSGGYHHAKSHQGEGFCVYADIPLAAYELWKKDPSLKILVVDLDAHQGNGHESVLRNEERVAIFDVYNNDIYPHDVENQQYIDFNYPVRSGIADKEYLALIREQLPKALASFNPNLIIYNAGTDIFADDPLGRMNISQQGIIERDEIVFQLSKNFQVPILMLLSGGYTKKSAEIITSSIDNLITKKLITITANYNS